MIANRTMQTLLAKHRVEPCGTTPADRACPILRLQDPSGRPYWYSSDGVVMEPTPGQGLSQREWEINEVYLSVC